MIFKNIQIDNASDVIITSLENRGYKIRINPFIKVGDVTYMTREFTIKQLVQALLDLDKQINGDK